MLRDVTREVRLEQMRKDFVANASHELRSPLTVVAGYLETFSGDPNLGELAAPIAEMRRQADRMTRIVEDLLALSRFEASDAPIKGQPIDVAAMASLLRKDVLARPTHPRQVELAIESAATLLGDENMVQSAFSNLVDNAAKYTPPEGSMQIRWWTDGEGGALLGTRHRSRHSRGAHSAPHRALLPRRSRPLAGHRRIRPRAGHRQARAASPRRPAGDREHRGPRQHLHLSLSAGARPRAARCGERLMSPLMSRIRVIRA